MRAAARRRATGRLSQHAQAAAGGIEADLKAARRVGPQPAPPLLRQRLPGRLAEVSRPQLSRDAGALTQLCRQARADALRRGTASPGACTARGAEQWQVVGARRAWKAAMRQFATVGSRPQLGHLPLSTSASAALSAARHASSLCCRLGGCCVSGLGGNSYRLPTCAQRALLAQAGRHD